MKPKPDVRSWDAPGPEWRKIRDHTFDTLPLWRHYPPTETAPEESTQGPAPASILTAENQVHSRRMASLPPVTSTSDQPSLITRPAPTNLLREITEFERKIEDVVDAYKSLPQSVMVYVLQSASCKLMAIATLNQHLAENNLKVPPTPDNDPKIVDLEFSIMCRNRLLNYGASKLSHLDNSTDQSLKDVYGLRRRDIKEVREAQQNYRPRAIPKPA